MTAAPINVRDVERLVADEVALGLTLLGAPTPAHVTRGHMS